jgi:hypothetical protein
MWNNLKFWLQEIEIIIHLQSENGRGMGIVAQNYFLTRDTVKYLARHNT